MSWGGDQGPYRSRKHSTASNDSSHASSENNSSGSVSSSSAISEPIAIVASPSTSSHSATLHDLHTSFDSALSFPRQDEVVASSSSSSDAYGHEGSIIDGPLRDLRPPLEADVSSSTSSSDTDSALLTSSPPSYRRVYPSSPSFSTSPLLTSASPSLARRVVSAPLVVFGSPRSPLANETHSSGAGFSHRRRSAQFPLPGSAHNAPLSSSSLCPSPQSSRRRRSSASLSSSVDSSRASGPVPPIVPHGSFVGSFEHSLLTGRLSALPSLPLPFLASIGVLGSANAPTRLRCPPHLNVPFEAFFYSGPEGTKGSSPYVGTIDLEAHYLSLLRASADAPASDENSTTTPSLPRFPGYRVPVRGQIQLVIKNPNLTAIKVFLIPYDLSGLDRDRQGGKTFVRQKSYTVDVADPSSSSNAAAGSKGRLRYAVHVHFCSPPVSTTPAASSGKKSVEPHYYLHGNVRVVFASRGLDHSEKLRVVAEGPHGEGDATPVIFAPYAGPGLEWDMARKKAKEREKVRDVGLVRDRRAQSEPAPSFENEEGHDGVGSEFGSPRLMPPIVDDPDGTAFDLAQSRSSTPPSSLPQPPPGEVFATAPTWPMTSTRGPFAKSNLSFSFVRSASPAPGSEISRSSSRSALSTSRPPSRNAEGLAGREHESMTRSSLDEEAGR